MKNLLYVLSLSLFAISGCTPAANFGSDSQPDSQPNSQPNSQPDSQPDSSVSSSSTPQATASAADSSQPTGAEPEPTAAALAALEVEEFTLEEVESEDIYGCGLAVWKPDSPDQPSFILVASSGEPVPMWMKIDGEVVRFTGISAYPQEEPGLSFYQTFESLNGEIQVELEARFAEQWADVEAIAIEDGTVRVEQAEQAVEISVVGIQGC